MKWHLDASYQLRHRRINNRAVTVSRPSRRWLRYFWHEGENHGLGDAIRGGGYVNEFWEQAPGAGG